MRFCLWLCAGKYALTQDRKPGEATGKASRRPEGCPRGQIDTLGYAQGYALPKGQPEETDTSKYENVHSNFNFSIGRLYFLRCSVYGGDPWGRRCCSGGAAANPPSRGGVLYPFLVSEDMGNYSNEVQHAIKETRVGLRWGMRSELSVKL